MKTTRNSFHVCPKCGKDHPNITKGGKQMYLCHECGRRFVEDIGKPSYYSWYDISAWRILIEETLQGKTLDESAEKLGIFHSTAWSWRHKRCHGVADKYLSRYCALWAKVYSLSGQDLADKVRSILGLFERKEDDGNLKTSKIRLRTSLRWLHHDKMDA